MDKKERFQLAKKNVKRRFPKAQTVVDSTGKFYVAQDGKDICQDQRAKTGAKAQDGSKMWAKKGKTGPKTGANGNPEPPTRDGGQDRNQRREQGGQDGG